jgi:hypothetical protein
MPCSLNESVFGLPLRIWQALNRRECIGLRGTGKPKDSSHCYADWTSMHWISLLQFDSACGLFGLWRKERCKGDGLIQ